MRTHKILVLSDSHGDIEMLERAIAAEENIDCIFHLGDHITDMHEVVVPPGCRVVCVGGNCDFSSPGQEEALPEVGGVRFLLCHGHRYRVKYSKTSLFYRAKELGVDIALFGHTHLDYSAREEGVLLLNPGAINRYRCFSSPTYLLITVGENKKISFVHKTLLAQ